MGDGILFIPLELGRSRWTNQVNNNFRDLDSLLETNWFKKIWNEELFCLSFHRLIVDKNVVRLKRMYAFWNFYKYIVHFYLCCIGDSFILYMMSYVKRLICLIIINIVDSLVLFLDVCLMSTKFFVWSLELVQ